MSPIGTALADPNAPPLLLAQWINGVLPAWSNMVGQTVSTTQGLVGGQSTAVILCYGQSLLGNHSQDSYTASSALNQMFNPLNASCYTAGHPFAGGSWDPATIATTGNNYLPRAGDKLIADSYVARTIICDVGVAATNIADWAPGGVCNPLLLWAAGRLAERGLTPANVSKFFLYQHQGENHDAVTSAAYAASGTAALNSVRNLAFNGATPFTGAKAIVATASYNAGTTSAAVTGGQALMVDGVNTFAGPNMDSIGAGSRWDGTHFNATGCATAANLLAAAVEAH